MASKTRAAGLGTGSGHVAGPQGARRAAPLRGEKRKDGVARAGGDWMGTRVLLVLVLTPALILFMSRKDVGHAANRPASRARVVEQWPSAGFHVAEQAWTDYPGRAWRSGRAPALPVSARYGDESDPPGADLIYARAMFLAGRYDSRPYWNHPKLEVGAPASRGTADLAIEHLIPCESMGKSVNRVDSNGKMSYGILQFQDWDEWEALSGLRGDPDNRGDAIRMAEWAVENGMINHWTCAQILKMM